ncbi:unnamed protein product [Meganyctiphanes norvegica]|uniref:Phosphatidic acid phosphatase type 2/haloperoxidase domain-containing protein n=1 Tax=Meganyctiphanes norvegica TaxID=48144 RepID=A0AAV2QXR2_MEGNR
MEINKEQCDLINNQLKSKMRSLKINPTLNVFINFVILFLVGIPVLLFAFLGEPKERGFYCNDDSLQYPLLNSTISTTLLIACGISIPVVFILVVELLRDLPLDYDSVFICKRRIPARLAAISSSIGFFLFGCACIQVVTDVTKYSIGRLRPHFHAACQTNWTSVNCTKDNHSLYIQSFTCPNTDHHVVRDARLSFFSGHASFSAFTMIYLIVYLEHKIGRNQPVLLKPFIQFLCLLLAIYTSISRVFDYHHHWSDVLFGFMAGATMALVFTIYVSRLIPTKLRKEKVTEMTLNP